MPDNPLINPHLMERLAFVRYLFDRAVEQCDQPEPMNSMALLSLHDATELWLQLACQHSHAPADADIKFPRYWEVLNHPPDRQLTHQTAMSRLNKARASLKHQGVFPSARSVRQFRSDVADFLTENTPKFFDIDFDRISLVELIQNESVRQLLQQADDLANTGDLQQAIDRVALAFADLMKNPLGQPIQVIGRPGRPDLDPRSADHLLRLIDAIGQELDHVHYVVNRMTEAMVLGIDYLQYLRFRQIAPATATTIIGRHMMLRNTQPPTQDEYRFCRDLVLETALRIQAMPLARTPSIQDHDPQASPSESPDASGSPPPAP